MPKYIASRTLTGDLDWNAQVIDGDAVDGVRRLKDDVADDLFLSVAASSRAACSRAGWSMR